MKRKSLPSIEWLVKKRISAGISSSAEYLLYVKGDLLDSDYSDRFKRDLLSELRRAQKHRKQKEATS
jgi:hypothetical protein